MKTTFFLTLLPLALAAPQPQDDGAIDPSDYQSIGFNAAAASYLAAEVTVTAGGIADAFGAAASDSHAMFPTDSAGQINANGVIAGYQAAATAVPSAQRAAYTSVLAQALALQSGATGAGASAAMGASSAVSVASTAAGGASSAASAAGSSASKAVSSAASSGSAAANAATSSAKPSSAKPSTGAAAQQTMAVGMMAGVLAGVAGLAAAL